MSKIVKRHKFRVEGGKVLMNDLARFNADMGKMEGKAGYMALLPEDVEASPSHRGYYFGIMLPGVLKTEVYGGWTKDELHKWIKKETETKSTSKMNVKEFSEFVEAVKDVFAKQDIFFDKIDDHYEYDKKTNDIPAF